MRRLLTVSATAAALVLSGSPLVMTAQASPQRVKPPKVGQGCNPEKNHAEVRSVTTYHSHPVVTHATPVPVAPGNTIKHSTLTIEHKQLTASIKGTVGGSAEVSGFWRFLAGKVSDHWGVTAAGQGSKTTTKNVRVSLNIHNGTKKQHTYVVFLGRSSFTGSYTVIYCKSNSQSNTTGSFVKGKGSYKTFPDSSTPAASARCGAGSGGSALAAEAEREFCH
jgi:hypothetical protein